MYNVKISVALWTLTSYCLHLAIATFLQHDERLPFGVSGEILALVVTMAQIGMGALVLQATFNDDRDSETLFAIAIAGHVIGTYTNNYLYIINYEHLTLALAVRLFEPITTSVASCLIEKQRISGDVLISIVILIIGSFVFTGVDLSLLKSKQLLLMAFMNVCYTVRNIAVKEFKIYAIEVGQRSTVISVSTFGFYSLLILKECTSPYSTIFLYPLILMMTTSLLHVVVSFLSTCIVKSVSVITHAVLSNMICCVAITLTLLMKGALTVSVTTLSGLTLLLLGVGIHAKCQHQKHDTTPNFQSLERLGRIYRVWLLCMTSSGVLYGINLLGPILGAFNSTTHV